MDRYSKQQIKQHKYQFIIGQHKYDFDNFDKFEVKKIK